MARIESRPSAAAVGEGLRGLEAQVALREVRIAPAT
jgi:hypothetical protein